jgi:copper(I)-binding protein
MYPANLFRVSAVVLVIGLVLAACSPGPGSPTVSDAWVRRSTAMDKPTAAYFVISNPGDTVDALVGASSPAAASVEIHETSTDASGMTGMHPIERIEIPAGGTVTLEPGGYHLMLMGLTGQLASGDTVELELDFEKAGAVSVEAPVREG